MAIKVGGVTVIDDGRNLSNISGGAITGIQSGGTAIGAGATTLNFTGSGNELTYNAGTNSIDITIAGSGGGGGGGSISPTGILTSGFYSNAAIISSDADLTQSDTNYFVAGPVSIASGTVINVGTGSTFKVL
jgi:hypothetical protein